MSFTQGLSGLNAASKDLEVIGNNVANVNTVGFKSSQAQFADVFAASLGGAGASQIGLGTKLATVAQQFTQGSITNTNNPLDMAINGPGFFVVHGVNGTGYTRNGQFQVDKNGNIVTSTGLNLQGWPASATGVVANSGPTSDLTISTNPIAPTITSTVTAVVNLDSRVVPPTTPFNPAIDPTSYNYSRSTTIYDVSGTSEMNTLYFVKAPDIANPVGNSVALTAAEIAPTAPATTPYTYSIANTAGLVVGETVTGGAKIMSIVNGTTFTTDISTGVTTTGGLITFGAAASATTTAASNVVTLTAPDSTLGMAIGQTISMGTEFPAGTTITSIAANGLSFTTSANAAVGGVTVAPTLGVQSKAWNVYTTIADPSATPTSPPTYLYPNPNPATGAWTPLGTMSFNINGSLASPASGQFTLPAPSGSSVTAAALNGPVTYNFSGSTQYGSPSSVTKLSADGSTQGNLVGYSAASDGTISGTYSNGQTQTLGQVALATFANNQGLQPLGNNEWASTTASGKPLTNPPGVALNGVLQTSSVEGSNVDLTNELVSMITAQRNYQANSQTIKTQDTIFQTLLNLR